MNTLKETLIEGSNILMSNNIADAKIDAWYLMEYAFNIDKVYYLTHLETEVSYESYNKYMEYINKRANRYPLQYIVGSQEFMGLDFQVNESVLIPRQDTEVLVEEVLKRIKSDNMTTVLDMCTGSGCIIISIAHYSGLTEAVGVDISSKALDIAKNNSVNNNAGIKFIKSNLFEDVYGKYDIIVSNPPYIPSQDIEELMEEVREYEPRIALDGMDDGLYFYRRIIDDSRNYLNDNGYIFFEIGYNQGEDISKLLNESGYTDINIIKDLAGLDRVVYAKK